MEETEEPQLLMRRFLMRGFFRFIVRVFLRTGPDKPPRFALERIGHLLCVLDGLLDL